MPEGDGLLAEAEDQGAGLGAVLNQLARGVKVEAAFSQVTEKRGVLVDDPHDAEPLPARVGTAESSATV